MAKATKRATRAGSKKTTARTPERVEARTRIELVDEMLREASCWHIPFEHDEPAAAEWQSFFQRVPFVPYGRTPAVTAAADLMRVMELWRAAGRYLDKLPEGQAASEAVGAEALTFVTAGGDILAVALEGRGIDCRPIVEVGRKAWATWPEARERFQEAWGLLDRLEAKLRAEWQAEKLKPPTGQAISAESYRPNWSKLVSKIDAAAQCQGVSVETLDDYLRDHPEAVKKHSRKLWHFDKNHTFFEKLP